jgi:DNA polymerase
MFIPPPPTLDDLRAGTLLHAGLGWTTILPSIDFETYSEAGYVWDERDRKWHALPGASQGRKGLDVVGLAVYATHPSTEVLCFSYNLRDGQGKRFWRPGMPNPVELFDYLARGGVLAGWNVGFEFWVWNCVCTRLYNWPQLPQQQLICSMAKARAHSLPGKLDMAGKVLDLQHKKSPEGDRLLKKFSVPRNPTKADPRTRIRPEEDPVDGPKLYAYNATDTDAEGEAGSRIPDLSPTELRYWRDDQAINTRGVQVDMRAVNACIAVIEQAQVRYGTELMQLTGCKPTELQKLSGWLHAQGVHLDSMDEESVEEALERQLPPQARRALEIRAAVGSASVKKVFAMRNQVSPWGRLHDLYTFHGARTGRPTGNGPQPTNLPKAGPNVYRCGFLPSGKPSLVGTGCGRWHGGHTYTCPWCGTARGPDKSTEWNPAAMEDAIEVVNTGSLACVEWFFGDAMLTIAGCLRGLFIAKPEHTLVSSDYSSIEGVVIAALAGEQWRLETYAKAMDAVTKQDKTRYGIYVVSASRAFGVPVDEFVKYQEETGQHHPLRDKGKRMELGLGFGGWINALRSPQIRYEGTDAELTTAILAWRGASPAVVHFWGGQHRDFQPCPPFGLEGMAVLAIQNPGVEYPVTQLSGNPTGVSYVCHGDALYCKVPSGGLITYHRPRLHQSEKSWRGLEITYEGWNTNPKAGPMGWVTMPLYAGKCAENVVQKVARDIQMNAIRQLEDAGLPVVLHTYDETASEVPVKAANIESFEQIINTLPPWAAGWPIKAAGGWVDPRYRKG